MFQMGRGGNNHESIEAQVDYTQFLSFILGNETYGVDILRVQEIRGWEMPTNLPGLPSYVKGVINIRGAIVPILDMRELFHIGEPTYDHSTVVVITRIAVSQDDRVGKLMGLVVDGVSDVVGINLNELQTAPQFDNNQKVSDEFIKGLASIEQKMVILLDVDKLLGLGTLKQAIKPQHRLDIEMFKEGNNNGVC
ncbi:chemotaxis protein CheW [Thiomicrospira microaerophila]|uniref:chemotaxis protein CheW n=1 Tax=Thiomicrospira microaerophila TaxID=406020 RepID=UPI000695D7FD|nr:chemotaxis protein CheW [Thiomicrospira microaerophila]